MVLFFNVQEVSVPNDGIAMMVVSIKRPKEGKEALSSDSVSYILYMYAIREKFVNKGMELFMQHQKKLQANWHQEFSNIACRRDVTECKTMMSFIKGLLMSI